MWKTEEPTNGPFKLNYIYCNCLKGFRHRQSQLLCKLFLMRSYCNMSSLFGICHFLLFQMTTVLVRLCSSLAYRIKTNLDYRVLFSWLSSSKTHKYKFSNPLFILPFIVFYGLSTSTRVSSTSLYWMWCIFSFFVQLD